MTSIELLIDGLDLVKDLAGTTDCFGIQTFFSIAYTQFHLMEDGKSSWI